jgi:hypothetical protein
MRARIIGLTAQAPRNEDRAMRTNAASGIAALAAAALVVGSAYAQETSPPQSDIAPGTDSSVTTNTKQFSLVDQNKDGRVSRAEAIALGGELGPAFERLDEDRDGQLSPTEFGKWKPDKTPDPPPVMQPVTPAVSSPPPE